MKWWLVLVVVMTVVLVPMVDVTAGGVIVRVVLVVVVVMSVSRREEDGDCWYWVWVVRERERGSIDGSPELENWGAAEVNVRRIASEPASSCVWARHSGVMGLPGLTARSSRYPGNMVCGRRYLQEFFFFARKMLLL